MLVLWTSPRGETFPQLVIKERTMNNPQQMQLEIQAVRMRLEWATKLQTLEAGTPAIQRFIDEDTKTLQL